MKVVTKLNKKRGEKCKIEEAIFNLNLKHLFQAFSTKLIPCFLKNFKISNLNLFLKPYLN